MILVTGAAGSVGKTICRLLNQNNIPFRAGIHRKKIKEIQQYTHEICVLDYNDRESIRKTLHNIQTILFIAPPSPKMAAMAENLTESVKNTDVSCIVKISAYGEQENILSKLGSWHQQADEVLRRSDIPYVFLSCMPFMQNFLYVADIMIKPYRKILLPCGEGRVSHIDMRDISSAAYEVLREPKKHIYNNYILTGRESLTYNQIAHILSEEIGMTITYKNISEHEAAKMMQKIGLPQDVIEAKLISFRLEKDNLRSYVSPHVRDLTGREPRSFKEFVRDYLDFFNIKYPT